jgi:hypothetical protein
MNGDAAVRARYDIELWLQSGVFFCLAAERCMHETLGNIPVN